MDRRALLIAPLIAAAFPESLHADTPAGGVDVAPSDPQENIELWPGVPPGGDGLLLPRNRTSIRTPHILTPVDRSIDQVGVPQLNVLRPSRPDGSALLIAPGGGYSREVLDLEGMNVGRHFNALGITCFVLRYRLPGEGWANRSDVPLQDAQRAIRLVRANAPRYGVDATRVGFLGFSAGGHVACSIATRFAAPVYAPIDMIDGLSARPDFSVAMYPVVTMGAGCHAGSRDHLLGPTPLPETIAAYSCEKHVQPYTPPTWICLCADDHVVPPLPNGVCYFTALRAAGVPAELHVFEKGGHGFGIANASGKPVQAWPELLVRWGQSHGFFTAT